MIKKKVLLGLSGGVDSSVAALLLKEQGYEVDALFMRNWVDEDGSPYCSVKEDFMDASFIADQLNINLINKDFSKEYKERVFNYFLDELKIGRTPNPDILCNKEIKFNVFYKYAMENKYDFIATGHYAQIKKIKSRYALLKGQDSNKDQSYFLHSIDESILPNIIFPLGAIDKQEVREIARANNLITSNKKDSTGICFIGERPFPEFLSNFIPSKEGKIIDESNRNIGIHKGLAFYTLGQRKGLGIGGVKNATESPWYVAEKNLVSNTLKVVQGNNNPMLMSNAIDVLNLSTHYEIPKDFRCNIKLRYRQEDQKCKVIEQKGSHHIIFEEPQRSVTPGQSAVLYRGEECLGGGEIDTVY